jgi:hypothetical protein
MNACTSLRAVKAITSIAITSIAITSIAGCASPAPATPIAPTAHAWRRALDRLAEIRKAAAVARTDRIALDVVEPRTGHHLTARGAVAIAPPRALRMILLGPGGTTALDIWIGGDRFRFALPALELVKRGSLSAPRAPRRGLPVDFLASWFLHPFEGALLWHARAPSADRFVLRDGSAIVDLVAHDDGRMNVRRITWSGGERIDEETVSAERIGCGAVRYHQASTGLDVSVRCEGQTLGEPAPRALADPDAEGS